MRAEANQLVAGLRRLRALVVEAQHLAVLTSRAESLRGAMSPWPVVVTLTAW